MGIRDNRFAFCVLTYNHEKCILDHLESILFLVETNNSGLEPELIISDDFSSDNTTGVIDRWLEQNANRFARVKKIYNNKNIGTAKSVNNLICNSTSKYIKITAGDDVYSFEDIFSFVKLYSNYDLLSGMPINLVDSTLTPEFVTQLSIIASSIIYTTKNFSSRFKLLSNTNAPNLVYNSRYLYMNELQSFLRSFDVTEDWPIQTKIAELGGSRFHQDTKTFVYYRRTSGSTYIVASDRFKRDKTKMYNYLISKEKSSFVRVLLRNRMFCFRLDSRFLNKVLNLALLKFSFDVLLNIVPITRSIPKLRTDIDKHQKHYCHIKTRVDDYLQTKESAM